MGVSRSSRLAARCARPQVLSTYLVEVKRATSYIQWLQLRVKQGMLAQLASLCVDSKRPDRDEDGTLLTTSSIRQYFWQPLLTLSGLWCLRTCTLEGAFEVEQAEALLPPCIEDLCFATAQSGLNDQRKVCLSMFGRFLGLHRLTLDLSSVTHGFAIFNYDACFVTDGSMILDKLETLIPTSGSRSPWSWCPALQNANFNVRAEQNQIDKDFSCKSLLELHLGLFGTIVPAYLSLSIEESSNLECIKFIKYVLSALAHVQIRSFTKKGLQCCFKGLIVFQCREPYFIVT